MAKKKKLPSPREYMATATDAERDEMHALVTLVQLRDSMVSLRRYLGISIDQCARRMGVPKGQVEQFETRKVPDATISWMQRYTRSIGGRFTVEVMPDYEEPVDVASQAVHQDMLDAMSNTTPEEKRIDELLARAVVEQVQNTRLPYDVADAISGTNMVDPEHPIAETLNTPPLVVSRTWIEGEEL